METAPIAVATTRNRNRLLAALPAADYAKIAHDVHPVTVSMGDVLQQPHQMVSTIWFPDDCLVSLRAETDSGAALELALAGNDSVIGMDGADSPSGASLGAVVQAGGSVMQIDAGILKKMLVHSMALQRLLYGALRDQMLQASLGAICSHYHLLEARVARSLLRMRDHMQMNQFHLTHEFLAHGLGVRRVGVTKAAGVLQSQGLICYARGDITIIDGGGLERAACACYLTDQHLQASFQQ